MSRHDVEDLIEDSIRCVLAGGGDPARQRPLVDDLYRFQAIFDTSDTRGRLRAELDAIGYRPQADQSRVIDVLGLVAEMMARAEAAGQVAHAYLWLAILVEGLDEGDISDHVPATFPAVAAHPATAAIREQALRLTLPKLKPKPKGVALRPWSALKPKFTPVAAHDIEHTSILRAFADVATPIAKIAAERDGMIAAAAALDQNPFRRLPQLGVMPTEWTFIGCDEREEGVAMLYRVAGPAEPGGGTVFAEFEHNHQLGLITAALWVISGDVARWQQRSDVESGPVHIVFNLFHLVAEDEIATSKRIHSFGGWRFKASQSEKALGAVLADIRRVWPGAAPALAFHTGSLAARLRTDAPERVLEDAPAIATTCGFFCTDIEVMFGLACARREDGRDIADDIARIAARLKTIHPKNTLRAHWTEGLAELEAGRLWFPARLSLIHAYQAV